MELNPVTRKETFLAAAGGQDVTTPTPITREEVFLDAIAKSGGGSSGGGVLVVGITSDSQTNLYSCNKTAGEIWSAYAAGSNVVFSDTEYDDVTSLVYAYIDDGTYGFFAGGCDVKTARLMFSAEASTDNPVQVQPG